MKLNAKQKLFISAYIATRNATKSALAAGYSKKSAKQMGTENLSKPSIRAAIDKQLAPLHKKYEITAERILNEIASVAYADITKFKKATLRIKTSDKMKALELLAKNQKLLTEVVETTGKDGGPQVILTLPSNGSEADKPKTKGEK